MKNILIHSWRVISNFLFPTHCVDCGTAHTYLCANCATKIPRADNSDLENCLALFNYGDARTKKLVWLLKYRGAHGIASDLAKLMLDLILEQLADWQLFDNRNDAPWILTATPLSPRRLRQRGYNQADKLARHLHRLAPDIFAYEKNLLVKIRETPAQTAVGKRAQRLRNLRDAFRVTTPDLVRGRRVIVVDDVTTTGATMAEARRALKVAGARSVLGLAVAHG